MFNSNLDSANMDVKDALQKVTEIIDKIDLFDTEKKDAETQTLINACYDLADEAKDSLEGVEVDLNIADDHIDELETADDDADEDKEEPEYDHSIDTGIGNIHYSADNLQDSQLMQALADCIANPKVNRNDLLSYLEKTSGQYAGLSALS